MSDTNKLVTVLSVAAGSSVVSALITTYATQTGERREARVHVREAMRPAEMAALAPATTWPGMHGASDDFIRTAQLAKLPMPLVDLYVAAVNGLWKIHHSSSEEELSEWDKDGIAAVYDRVFRLVVELTWHPHRTRVMAWRKTRRYRRILIGSNPRMDWHYSKLAETRGRTWEKAMLRKERNERNDRRAAKPVH